MPQYDVVVFGATGFTGTLVARHLANHPTRPTWAVAGRDEARLAKVRAKLSLSPEDEAKVGTIVARTEQIESLRRMVLACACVINVVGPYRLYGGEKLAKICAEEGRGYVDLSGETLFNLSLQRYHDTAISTGAILAPSVGFDSLPFDLTTFLAVQQLKKQGASEAVSVDCSVKAQGGVSTGTALSGLDMADQDRRQLQDTQPDWLSPIKGTHKAAGLLPWWSEAHKGWAIWVPLTPHNHRIVNRTWGLLQSSDRAATSSWSAAKYGPRFQYRDGVVLTRLYGVALLVSLLLRVNVAAMLYLRPVRWAMRKLLPRNGGPSEKAMLDGSMDVRTVARDDEGRKAICVMKVDKDPGYWFTAQMLLECGLLIAQDRDQLPKGGVLTAATLNANRLAERLERYAGARFETRSF